MFNSDCIELGKERHEHLLRVEEKQTCLAESWHAIEKRRINHDVKHLTFKVRQLKILLVKLKQMLDVLSALARKLD